MTKEEKRKEASRKWAIKRREYDRSFEGLPCRRYRDMLSRVSDRPQYKGRWAGLEIVGRQEFVEWARGNDEYSKVYKAWEESGFDKDFSPSVHRINDDEGYIFENISWLPRSEHTRISLAKAKETRLAKSR